ncbi:glycosyltransferase [Microbulbifer aggregans]|uniref:glycosyltransferase n=1 Tax=Microbulbifer aggregans TaxID=1769779 RepID=UPI001CFF16C0|nr:glycosyltransferase [Microbulbifer aggregans]
MFKISVVVPTYNSVDLLEQTLQGFSRQSVSRDQFEVIVVDDGSTDDTKSLVDEYSRTLDISYHYQEDLGYRLSAARNVGINFAKYPVTLIFDCGMLPSKFLLEQHIKMHAGGEDIVLVGLSYGVEEFSMDNSRALQDTISYLPYHSLFYELNKFEKFYDCRYDYCRSVNFDISKNPAAWVMCWGGHMSSRTEVFRRVGGFDEWFTSWGGEDVEIAIRLYKLGCQFKVMENLEALHIPHFRCETSNVTSSENNIKYILEKHSVPGVELLATHGWRDIMNLYDVNRSL